MLKRLKKTNKKFEYQTRYYESRREQGPFKIEYKFDEFRTTVGKNKGLLSRFKTAFAELKENKGQGSSSRIILIVIFILVLLFLFIIDFDLSIFRRPL